MQSLPSAQPIRILLVDDHRVILEGLKILLADEEDLMVVGEATRGAEAEGLAQTLRPDVILLDLGLPDTHGIDVLNRILLRNPRARVLVFTASIGDAHIQAVIQGGARGYVLKDAPREEICRAIRDIARGIPYFTPMAAARMATTDPKRRLTKSEQRVLEMIGAGLSNEEIAKRQNVGVGTIKTHVHSILGKLNVRDRAAALAKAVAEGRIWMKR